MRPQECPKSGTQEKLAGQEKEAPEAQRKPARGSFFSCVFGFLCVGFLKENYQNDTTHKKKLGSACAFDRPPVRLFPVLQTFPVCRSLVVLGATPGPSGDPWRPHLFDTKSNEHRRRMSVSFKRRKNTQAQEKKTRRTAVSILSSRCRAAAGSAVQSCCRCRAVAAQAL